MFATRTDRQKNIYIYTTTSSNRVCLLNERSDLFLHVDSFVCIDNRFIAAE